MKIVLLITIWKMDSIPSGYREETEAPYLEVAAKTVVISILENTAPVR